ncbi:flagellar hook-basal body complex protein FliE [Caldalkalibacillus salinus]|uniref:flagellar hook-basal body complex protein FliE n=1 Tax=Caldalkalibacillus salinus TaxID=2803787 RepID=UPI001922FB87|nr:flagellar hook-basal body complex protein FliE [Caldalkalibacillus salinus]
MSHVTGITPTITNTIDHKQEDTKTHPTQMFQDVFREALNKVNERQLESDRLTQQLVTGEVDDIHSVMIASQKANLSLQLTVETRNKVVEAYKEIMRMQV